MSNDERSSCIKSTFTLANVCLYAVRNYRFFILRIRCGRLQRQEALRSLACNLSRAKITSSSRRIWRLKRQNPRFISTSDKEREAEPKPGYSGAIPAGYPLSRPTIFPFCRPIVRRNYVFQYWIYRYPNIFG
jgi:hypothetical protein